MPQMIKYFLNLQSLVSPKQKWSLWLHINKVYVVRLKFVCAIPRYDYWFQSLWRSSSIHLLHSGGQICHSRFFPIFKESTLNSPEGFSFRRVSVW